MKKEESRSEGLVTKGWYFALLYKYNVRQIFHGSLTMQKVMTIIKMSASSFVILEAISFPPFLGQFSRQNKKRNQLATWTV
jgi:hypothetical protein